jgi:acetyl-CoA carboxylase biotin carboxyl carrier protein
LNKPLATLSDEEVRQIALLVETLEKSTFDFLQLELGDLKVTIGKGNAPPETGAAQPVAPPRAEVAPPAAPSARAPAAEASPERKVEPAPSAARDTGAHEGTVAVVAPMIGRFYAKPEPGAQPFVSVGTEVTPDSTVALVEVMKVFTAVRAGVRGVVSEICVQDEQLVEYGQVLFRIRPIEETAEPAAGKKDSRRR